MKLALLWSKSDAYCDYLCNKVAQKWDVDMSQAQRVELLSQAGGTTLFGDSPVVVITADDTETIKNINAALKTMSASEVEKHYSGGLMVVSTGNAASVRALSKTVSALGGDVCLQDSKASSVVTSLLKDTSMSSSVQRFLADYAGDDYDVVLPVVVHVTTMPPVEQKSITVDDVVQWLPSPPGTVPPWSIEGAVFGGRVQEAVDLLPRCGVDLAVLAVLKNKADLMFRAYQMNVHGGLSVDQIAEALDRKSYPVKLALSTAKNLGENTVTRCALTCNSYDAKIKGASYADSSQLVQLMVIELCQLCQ